MSRIVLFVILAALSAHAPHGQAAGLPQSPCQPPALRATSAEQNMFTEQQEVDLGDAIAEHVQRDYRVLDDEEVAGYLNRLGQRIVKHVPPTSLRFQFLLVDLPDATAFVLPGGRIYVSRKLVALTQSEDELAGVIGHEIGHLLARHSSVGITRLMREVLGVREVKDRRDIFTKYLQLIDNYGRKPGAFSKGDNLDDHQLEADHIGLFATASAGYDPQAFARFFDRLTENKGKTGNFFSELFGTTRPESKRLREMIKTVSSLPPSCIEPRAATAPAEFQKWQAAVVNYTGPGRKEALHSVLRKVTLDPPLRGEINHLRFSPDGKHLLAQDDSGVNVLTVEPFAPLFRIEAPEAMPAQFSPDSKEVIVYNSALRVETWAVADQKLKSAREMFVRKLRLQTLLSPDGKTLACLDANLDLTLFDVATAAQVFQKKSFYLPNIYQLLYATLQNSDLEEMSDEVDWINMEFSPDSRYFAAGSRGTSYNTITGSISPEDSAIAVDLGTRQSIPLRGPLKKLLAGGFTFIAPDRVIGIDRAAPKKSAIVSFPSGEVLDQVMLGRARLSAPTRGNYLMIRPISGYPLGVMDLATKKIFIANKQSAFDIYDQLFVSERMNGELGLYKVEKQELRAAVLLPRNPLGRLRAAILSHDLKWLAISERTRGGVWNLAKGERSYLVRGFRDGHFGEDGAFYADFPKFEEASRAVARLDLARRDVGVASEINDVNARQSGPFVVVVKPAKNAGDFRRDVVVEVRDVRSTVPLWSKPFAKEAPQVWLYPPERAMALSWPVSANAAQSEIKSDPALARQLASMKEKEGDYFLRVLDAQTGDVKGRLLIETGKGSFRISRILIAGDRVALQDTQNRILVYSLSTGEQKGKVFGGNAAISSGGRLLGVENEPGQLTLYELETMEKRDQFSFSSPVALAQFSRDGKSLFVLTATQTVYHLDVSSPAR